MSLVKNFSNFVKMNKIIIRDMLYTSQDTLTTIKIYPQENNHYIVLFLRLSVKEIYKLFKKPKQSS